MTFVRAAATCGTGQFQCDNGRCVPAYWTCNGINSCGDMSDERNCLPLSNTGIYTIVSLFSVT